MAESPKWIDCHFPFFRFRRLRKVSLGRRQRSQFSFHGSRMPSMPWVGYQTYDPSPSPSPSPLPPPTALLPILQQILALNCLISAYSLSVLYLDGVKYGDRQMTALGMLMSVSFITISRAKPLSKLSPVRPITSIFHPALFISILGQVTYLCFSQLEVLLLCCTEKLPSACGRLFYTYVFWGLKLCSVLSSLIGMNACRPRRDTRTPANGQPPV